MAVLLSDCAKAFINFLTGRYRQQLKQLLQNTRKLIEIELTSLVAKIARLDIIALTFVNGLNSLNTVLQPIESQLAQIPFSEFRNCAQVSGTLGELQNIYFDKKSEYTDILYKNAQFTFARSHAINLRDKLQNQLDVVDAMIEYLDNIASLDLLTGDNVYVYTQETDSNNNSYPVTRLGTIDSVGATTSDILMDDTGQIETFDGTDIQPRT